MKIVVFTVPALALLLAVAACDPGEMNGNEPKCPEGAVDLGIVMTREDGSTYHLYWAKSNLCESGLCAKPEDYGDYYAWGEVTPKMDYTWLTYKFRTTGDSWENVRLSKYITPTTEGAVDNKAVLDPADDAAHAKLGGKWRMPTVEEWTALRDQCTWESKTQNGVDGRLGTAPNGNSIFLPAAGYRHDPDLDDAGVKGYYWSSSLQIDNPEYPTYSQFAWYTSFSTTYGPGKNLHYRFEGQSVRPVSE